MRWGLAAVLAALVLAAPAAAGSSFTDPTGDSGTAADIVSVTVSNDTNGQYTFVVGFASDYVGNDNMGIYLDTDRNPNTGDANASGADYSISDDRASQTFELDKWDGSQWTAAAEGSFTLSVSSDHRSVTASVNKADLGGATSFNFYVGSYDGNGGAGHYDDAPSGSGTFEYTLQAAYTLAPYGSYSKRTKTEWDVVFGVRRSDGQPLGQGATVQCSGAAGSATLQPTFKGLVTVTLRGVSATAGACAFRLPKKHATLTATVKVTSADGQALTKTFSLKT